MKKICDTFRPLTKDILRDLLWSGLTVIEGKIAHLSNLSYGQWMGPSAQNLISQPLEWFCRDPDSLFSEYLHYRELLVAALIEHVDADQGPDEVRSLLDVIHLRYLIKHAPDAALEFVAEQQVAGVDLAAYWSRREIPLPDGKVGGIGLMARTENLDPVRLRGHERSYILFPSFYAPPGNTPLRLDNIVPLINILDSYCPAIDTSSKLIVALDQR